VVITPRGARRPAIGRLAPLVVGVALAAGARPARADLGRCSGLEELERASTLPFSTGEELDFRLSFGGAYIGKLETRVGDLRNLNGRSVLPLFGRARTSVFVASLAPMKGRYMSMVDPETLDPLGLQTELEYGGDDRWEKVRFTGKGRRVEAKFRVRGKEHERRYAADHELTDILTLFFLARTVRLHPGLTACQDVFSARRLWRMTAQVVGIEDVATVAGTKRAYHVKLHFLRKPHPTLRENNPPQYDLEVYLSADRFQTPLAFVMEYKGTKASGELARWKLGQ
jgi:hypothetical protein